MVTFTCSQCGQTRTGARQRCYVCTGTVLGQEAREQIRQTLTGVKHGPERRQANSEGPRKRTDNRRFDLAALTRGKASPKALPIGSTWENKEGRVWIKVAGHGRWHQDWKRRAHIVWETANGPIPHGRIIHHINQNEGDDALDNLLLLTRAEHLSIHSTPEKHRAAQLLGVAARKRNGTYKKKGVG